MSDTKLPDLPLTSYANGNPPGGEDWLYLVNRRQLTDSTAGSSRRVSVAELGTTLLNAIGIAAGINPGGRLTLTTGVPVTTADVASSSTVYYTPAAHNVLPLWDNTIQGWRLKRFRELSVTLASLTSGKNYDVFAAWDVNGLTYRANSTGSLNASSSVTLPTRASGDRLIVCLTCSGASAPAANTGWTRLGTQTVSTTLTVAAYTKISDGTDSTGPLAATATGVYSCVSVQNGTYTAALWQSPNSNTSVAILTGTLDNFLNPECIYVGGWSIESNSATITPDTANAFAAALTTLGTQTFPSGTGRHLAGYAALPATDYGFTSNQAQFSASVNAIAWGVVISPSPYLVLGTAWTNDTTRAVSLDWSTGRFTYPTSSGTYLYLGTIRTISSTTTTDTEAQRYVWNHYNRAARRLYVAGYSTAAYSYTTASWRQVANQANQKVEYIVGIASGGDAISICGRHRGYAAAGANPGLCGIAYNSTTAPSAVGYFYGVGAAFDLTISLPVVYLATTGYSYVASLEFGATGVTYDSSSTGNGLWGTIQG